MGSIRVRQETGLLYFDFRFNGLRCREQSSLKNTKANRVRMEGVLSRIEKSIADGTFNYRDFFPHSKRVEIFEGVVVPVAQPSPDELRSGAAQALEAMRETKAPVVVGSPTPLFVDFSDQWYQEREVGWKRSNQHKVADILRGHLVPRFRGRRVGDITKADILALRTHLAKDYREGQGLSAARINGILNILRQILEEAADRYEFTTPFRGIKPLRVPRTDVDPFSLDEVRAILDTVPDSFRPYYTAAFFTGMRTSELLGLKWQYVDFDRNQIRVQETWVYGAADTAKNASSERIIDMATPVRAALLAHREASVAQDSEFVFCNRNGKPHSLHNLAARVWRPTLKTLRLRPRRPYQTRHTAATLWLAAGESPEWICRQMGHTSTKMLFTVYSRYVPNLTRRDGSAIEQVLRLRGFAEANEVAGNESSPDGPVASSDQLKEVRHA